MKREWLAEVREAKLDYNRTLKAAKRQHPATRNAAVQKVNEKRKAALMLQPKTLDDYETQKRCSTRIQALQRGRRARARLRIERQSRRIAKAREEGAAARKSRRFSVRPLDEGRAYETRLSCEPHYCAGTLTDRWTRRSANIIPAKVLPDSFGPLPECASGRCPWPHMRGSGM